MKNKSVNQKVLRAISIGLSAMMAVTPMTAMAAEGDNTGNPDGGNLEADINVEAAEVEVSEISQENQSEVMDGLTEVKDAYNTAGEEATTESEAGNYAEVAGNVSDILSEIEELNKANDNAASDKETFEEKTDAAEEAVEAADKALGNAEDAETEDSEGTSLLEKTESANEITGDFADDAEEAEQNAANAGSRTEVEQAAEDADNAATAAEIVNSELQGELSEAEKSVVAAELAVEEAAKAYETAKASAQTAQNALAAILSENGLTDVTALYTVDEEGNIIASEEELAKLDGDAAAAVQAALEACRAADAEIAAAEQELSQNKLVFAGKISELQEQIKTLEKQEYWDATKIMNEYLIRYALAENEDYILDENSFGKWQISRSTGFENDNYVPVTMQQAVKDENGEYVLDDNGNKTYEEVTKYFNYHKEDKTIATGNDKDKSIYVVEKNQETGTKTVTDAEAYTEYWLANAEGNRLESVTDEDGNVTSHKIVTTDSEGNKTETEVSGEIVTVKKGEDESSQAVLDDTVFENRVSESDVLKQTSVGDSKNGSVTTKEVVEGSQATSYEYTTVTVVDEYGTKNVKRDSEKIYYKSDAKAYISKAFQTENTAVTIRFDKEIDGKLFHSTEYSFTYNSREEFEANFSNDVKGLGDGVLWKYNITVYDVVTDYDNVIRSHEAEAVIATTTADIKATTDSVETVVTKAKGSKITGDKKSSVSSADDNVRDKLVNSYKDLYPGCTVSYGDYNKWNGEGTFTVTSADGLTVVEVSYDIDTDLVGWRKYKSSVTYSEKKAVTSKGSSEATENQVLSQNVYLADVYTNGFTDHAAVTHEEEYKYWKESEEALITESSVDFTEYNSYTAAKQEAEEKAAQAKSLYEKLLTALNNVKNLKAAENVDAARLDAAQDKVAELRTAYSEAAEAAKTAEENAKAAREAADRAALYAANWVDPAVPAVPTVPTVPTDAGEETVVIEEQIIPLAVAAPIVPVNAVNPVDNADQEVEEEAEVVEIPEEETPLADAPEVQEEADDNQEFITISDEETPLAVYIEDEKQSMNWWWLLIVAVLGATGYEMFRKNQKKKEMMAAEQEDAE